jgi:hypothetical protein
VPYLAYALLPVPFALVLVLLEELQKRLVSVRANIP